ncbi:ROK family transcriptional regulator [Enterococcus faecalis]|uniref:ROK family transcriptional regulator n=1 Tax=Enterococcus faecalis TaxID=1351 RepID=UPI0040415BAB
MTKKNITKIYSKNRSTVIKHLYRHPKTSRIEISKLTGLTPATVTKIIGNLIDENIVIETGDEINGNTGSGRKQKIIKINGNKAIFIGVEVNVKGIFAVATNLIGKVLIEEKFTYPYDKKNINNEITNLIKKVVSKIKNKEIYGAGIAIPGHFDIKNKSIVSNNQSWAFFNLLEISNKFKFPFIAENNIKSMAIGEYLFNVQSSPENFLFFHIGAGMFCSFFQSKNLGFNSNYYLGEIGHTVVDINGPQCECGKQGCLQTYISDTWLLKRANFLFNYSQNTTLKSLVSQSKNIDLSTIIHAYELGDIYIYNQVNLGLNLLATSIANSLIFQDAHKIYINSELLNYDSFRTQLVNSVNNQLSFIPTQKNNFIEVLNYNVYRGANGASALAALVFFIKHTGYSNYC